MSKHLITASVLAVCLSLSPMSVELANAKEASPAIAAPSAAVLDVTDQSWLTLYHAEDKLYPASLTKLLTAILLVEHTKPADILTASPRAAAQEPSNISLRAGEKLTAKDCLYAMLLHSANDVAYMVGENIGGSVPKFADMMNARAKELGMTQSHFVTPNGLHDPNHYSTARDLAILMQAALQYPEIREALKTKTYTLHRTYEPNVLVNQNEMLSDPSVLGGKSGFTDQAGSCLIEAANRKGHELIAVNLKSPSRDAMYGDNHALLDSAFNQFAQFTRSSNGLLDTWASSLTGIRYAFHLKSPYTSTDYVRIDDVKTTLIRTNFSPFIMPGEEIGTYQIERNGQTLANIPVIATFDLTGKTRTPPLAASVAIASLTALLRLSVRRRKTQIHPLRGQRTPATPSAVPTQIPSASRSVLSDESVKQVT